MEFGHGKILKINNIILKKILNSILNVALACAI